MPGALSGLWANSAWNISYGRFLSDMGIAFFGPIVGYVETAMPWLLFGAPIVAALPPASGSIRLRRAAYAFLLVLFSELEPPEPNYS